MNEIRTTKNYNIFKKMKGNRDVTEQRVSNLMKSIMKVGWISNPIIVNEKMEIIDGQGRLEALKRLHMPVEYHIVEDASLEACRVMNMNNKIWSTQDFIESFAATGNKDCQRIQQLMKYFNVTLDVVFMATGRSTGGRAYTHLKNGDIEFSESDYIQASRNLNIHKRYIPSFKGVGGRTRNRDLVIFYIIKYADTHKDVDHDKIIDSLENCDPRDIHSQSFERMLESIQDIYNKNRRKENRLYFYEEYRMDHKL